MTVKLSALAWILIPSFFVLAGCAPATPMPGPVAPSRPPVEIAGAMELAPDEVVETFYRWYLDYPGHALVDEALPKTGYLTAAFEQRIEDLLSAPQGLRFDPILCAQDQPNWIKVDDLAVTGDEAAVKFHTSFPNHYLEVRLHLEEAIWRIDEIICSPPQSVETAPAQLGNTTLAETGWQLYRNDRFEFQFALPPGWSYRDLPEANGGPPLGPPNVHLMILFMPEAWAAPMAASGPPDLVQPALAPFDLEVSVGSMEDYRQLHREPDRSELVDFTGTLAIREEQIYAEGLRIIHYIFQHPTHADLRVTFMDPITGFPARLRGNEGVVEQFEAILETFAWID